MNILLPESRISASGRMDRDWTQPEPAGVKGQGER